MWLWNQHAVLVSRWHVGSQEKWRSNALQLPYRRLKKPVFSGVPNPTIFDWCWEAVLSKSVGRFSIRCHAWVGRWMCYVKNKIKSLGTSYLGQDRAPRRPYFWDPQKNASIFFSRNSISEERSAQCGCALMHVVGDGKYPHTKHESQENSSSIDTVFANLGIS